MTGPVGGATCTRCGKRSYLSKGDAKAAIKQLAQVGKRKGRLHPYRCGSYWHIGHMPGSVRAGKVSRDQVADRGRRPQPQFADTEFRISSKRRTGR